MSKRRRLLYLYLALLVASNLTRFLVDSTPPLERGDQVARLQVVDDYERGKEEVCLVFRRHTPLPPPTLEDVLNIEDYPTVVLLHGSPGNLQDFRGFMEQLPDRFQVLVPDLPGFGKSRARLPDYSPGAHAEYLVQLLDAQALQSVHLVGFSMGSAVALEFAHRYPERVDSLIFAGGIGVEELELFGDHALNHSVHAVQAGLLQAAEWLLPHFGMLERQPLNVAYARNFFDSDQRPYRRWLKELEAPMLILHGTEDFLVPVEAGREHHRLVPQSELIEYDDSHFLLWSRPEVIAADVAEFVDSVGAEEAVTRTDAEDARVAASAEDFDPAVIPPFAGPALLFAMLMLALATLVSEDLTCIATGLLVAQGRISLIAGSTACFAGILIGDVLLFLAGRALGRGAVRRIPLRWLLTPAAVDRASAWFRRRGAWVIFASRFMPGLRLPTYFAAGVLKTRFLWFLLYFSLAGLLWTPTLVWISSRLGIGAETLLARFQDHAVWVLLGILLLVFVMLKLVVPLFSFRGRRSLVGSFRRKRHWEYWPRWRLYLPILPAILSAAWKYRSLRLVTAVNPAMEGGGLVGESKSAVFRRLAGDHVPPCGFLAADRTLEERIGELVAWMREDAVHFPVILKPDAGERGFGVRKIDNLEEARTWLQEYPREAIAQPFVEGLEFGISYLQLPGQVQGRITSIAAKIPPSVTGDGKHTLERLILNHPRHVAMADILLGSEAEHLYEIPAAGEEVALHTLGTHALGAEFVDRNDLLTPALEAAIREISSRLPGFHMGRYDLRVPSIEDLQAGENLSILELNGLTGEPAHLYDRKHSVRVARATLRTLWRDAFDIAAANRAAGAKMSRWSELWRLYRSSR
ncbi:MAG: alpha/beta fold hydrolase [Planctomycetota bacterium]